MEAQNRASGYIHGPPVNFTLQARFLADFEHLCGRPVIPGRTAGAIPNLGPSLTAAFFSRTLRQE